MGDWKYKLIELEGIELASSIKSLSRLEMIEWLQWNDRNGIYEDKQSMDELGRKLTRKEGIEIISRQISGVDA